MLSLALVGTPAAQAQPAPNGPDRLRSLPPIQALPITSGAGSKGTAPAALTSPPYCDSDTLRTSATIRALQFWGQERGVAVGDHGSILVTADGGRSWKDVESGVQCRLNDVLWVDDRIVVALGGGVDVVTRISRGAILVSHDAGASWRRSADSELPLLYSVERTRGNHSGDRRSSITAVGAPDPITGATSFQSRDGGRSWQSMLAPRAVASTDALQRSPIRPTATAEQSADLSERVNTRSIIRASCQLDDQTILCAGDHGNIFRSTDGGQTWSAVRSAAWSNDASQGPPGACAMLVIAANEDRVPWALIGRETLEKRLRCNLVVGTLDASGAHALDHALDQAAMRLGVAAVDSFAASDEDVSLATLRRWIDVHQPPILVLDDELSAETKTALLQHAVAGGAEKVVEYALHGRGETLLHDSAMLPESGVLAGDFAADGLMLVSDFEFASDADVVENPWVAINTRYSGGSQFARGDSLGLGVRLNRGHRLPPRQSKASRRRLHIIQGRLKQQAAIIELLGTQTDASGQTAPDKFAEALSRLLDQTSREDQFRSAWSIARRSVGQSNPIAVWEEVARRFDGASAAQLLGLHARARQQSQEWDRHRALINGLRPSGAPVATSSSGVQSLPDAAQELLPTVGGHAAIVSPFQSNRTATPDSQPAVIQASAALPLGNHRFNGLHRSNRLLTPFRQASEHRQEHKIDLAWQMHPVRLIVEDALARKQRSATEQAATEQAATEQGEKAPTRSAVAEHDFSADVRRIADHQSPWSSLLRPSSRQTAIAVKTAAPPRLDGRLQEPFWNDTDAQPAQTRGRRPLTLRFAWDEQYLYVAVQGSAEHFVKTVDSEPVGRRDADLTQSDRVTLGFDIDRDLLTAMNLSFTRRGRTHDDLDGSDRWNPTWYVATHASGDGVLTAEIAIEQRSLAVSLREGDTWFVEAQSLAAGRPRRYHLMPDPLTRVRVDFR
ncbi:Ycf48-like protein [Stieleria neptunia]|uniref:Ycf48-like protein n=1 Tax=Stieleria neptunia TaxID=2527979 RepID=A0A518HK38_9BACT|nr:hypothetical protein [Stieleria neptunia]QDV41215.1 Ycf48-like protein [Stieleria neptunia]